ncbi:MAG: hypothetical protein JWO60_1660 [Frankiales bacterium]|nr:hypothetical protein [Frankiales bacterium]
MGRTNSLDTVQTTSLVPDRILVAAAVVLTCVLFLPDAADPVNVVKLTALLLCTLAVVGLAAVRVLRTRVVQLPTGLPAYVALFALAAFLLATVVAPHTPTAVIGTNGRNAGLLAYGSALVLYLAVLRVFDAGATRGIALAVLLAGLFTSTYGILQYRGIDAVGWNNPFNPIIAGLGNPNFAAAYIGISVPCAVWGALWTGWPVAMRILSGGTAALGLVVAVLSDAVQGPLAAAAGVAVLAVAVVLDLPERRRRPLLAALAVVSGLGLALLLVGVTGRGPASAFFSGVSFRNRTFYWQAAVSMWQRSPLYGVGLDSYGIRWRQERPIEAPRELGGDHYSDAAHDVFLQMSAQGGVVLGLAFLLFAGVVGFALVRGLRRLEGQERLLLGALGGAWTAYQVQALVSIDQVPLLLLNYVLGGAVVVAAGCARLKEVRLPGALEPVDETVAKRRRVAVLRERQPTGLDLALIGLVGVLLLGLGWLALRPTLAAQDAYDGARAAAAGDGTTAESAYESAIGRAPYLAAYRTGEATLYNDAGDTPKALEAFREAAEADPFDIGAVRTTGRLYDAVGDAKNARTWFERAARLDPTNSSTVLDLAKFELKQAGGAQRARDLLEPLVLKLPKDGPLWATLGDARLVTGDVPGARQAYETALSLVPGEPTATAGLSKLPK